MKGIVRHGAVIGQFAPPHDGHAWLVRAAASACERLTVFVLGSPSDPLPLAQRTAWIRDAHAVDPNVVVAMAPIADGASEAAYIDAIREVIRREEMPQIEAVFGGLAWEATLAAALHAKWIALGEKRSRLVALDSDIVRREPVAHWEALAVPARAWLARRVVLVGAESTGKTTLAHAIADALRARGGAHGLTRWVPEYGHEVSFAKLGRAHARARIEGAAPPGANDLDWQTEEFTAIAREQSRREDEAARIGGPVLICDTDAFATAVWHERYLERSDPEIERFAEGNDHALYLLTHPDDVPFSQDGVRDGEHLRSWMTARFEERLAGTGRRFVRLRGTHSQRLQSSLAAIDALLDEGWRF